MDLFGVVLALAVLLCGLVSGLLLGFVIVAMPGLGSLGDRDLLVGFRAMDKVIQDRQPIFMIVWLGSVVAVIAAVALGWSQTSGGTRALLLSGALFYLLGLQLPTATMNIPLNNRVQAIDPASMSAEELAEARAWFEAPWNRWNAIRTFLGVLATGTLLATLVLL